VAWTIPGSGNPLIYVPFAPLKFTSGAKVCAGKPIAPAAHKTHKKKIVVHGLRFLIVTPLSWPACFEDLPSSFEKGLGGGERLNDVDQPLLTSSLAKEGNSIFMLSGKSATLRIASFGSGCGRAAQFLDDAFRRFDKDSGFRRLQCTADSWPTSFFRRPVIRMALAAEKSWFRELALTSHHVLPFLVRRPFAVILSEAKNLALNVRNLRSAPSWLCARLFIFVRTLVGEQSS
jgi:hypothetical protein